MKDIIKNLTVSIYCFGLFGAIGYSILNPRDTYYCLRMWEGDPSTVTASIILVSSWILTITVLIWMIIDKIRSRGESK